MTTLRRLHFAYSLPLVLTLAACPDDSESTGSGETETDDSNSNSNSNSATEGVTLTGSMTMTTMTDPDSSGPSTTVEPTTDATATDPTSETVDPDSSSSVTDEGSSSSDGSESSSSGEPAGDTIYDIQTGVIAEDTVVQLDGVVVTAIRTNRFWVQEPDGGENSGVLVYAGDAAEALGVPDLAIGDIVDVGGTVVEFDELTEVDVSGVTGTLSATGESNVLTPDVVDIDVFGAAATAEPWESTLVRIEGVIDVVSVDMTFNEITVAIGADQAEVDDFIYDAIEAGDLPGIAAGATFDAIQGPVNFFNDEFKIMPREATDLEGYEPPL